LVFECSEFNVLSDLLSFTQLVGKSHVSVGIKSQRIGSSVPDEDRSPVFDTLLDLDNKSLSVGLLGSEHASLLLSFTN